MKTAVLVVGKLSVSWEKLFLSWSTEWRSPATGLSASWSQFILCLKWVGGGKLKKRFFWGYLLVSNIMRIQTREPLKHKAKHL